MKGTNAPIVIKRRKSGVQAPHHAGAWKVAIDGVL